MALEMAMESMDVSSMKVLLMPIERSVHYQTKAPSGGGNKVP